jgi:hypothetical protein
MSFREKTAWVSLCAIIAVSILYWLHVPTVFEPVPTGWVFHALLACVGVYILIEVIAYIVLRLRNPEDARDPRDEREKLIDMKARSIAYYVFVVGALVGIFVTLHLIRSSSATVGMVVWVAFVLAELVKQAMRIYLYRRGA